jgi:glycosyltransferase involved in cell wall biosynthesis
VIVSAVFNDVERDSRVRRMAATLAAHGGDVLILGMGSDEDDREHSLGAVTVRILASGESVPRSSRWAAALAERVRGGMDRSQERRRRRTESLKADAKEARRLRRRADAASMPEAEARAALANKRLRAARRRNAPRRAAEAALRRLERRLRRHAFRSWKRAWMTARMTRMTDELAALAPAAIHANDADGLAAATAAASRLERNGKRPLIVYDSHEWTVGRTAYLNPPPPGIPSEVELEGRLIGGADAVITVSRPLAARLRERYLLTDAPTVVHNAPSPDEPEDFVPLRALAGVPPDAALLVYVGWVAERRGVHEAVAALVELPGVHLAVLGPQSADAAAPIERLAEELGVADRVTVVPPVSPEAVVATIRDADLGLMPWRRNEQHDVTMANKLFEYARAKLPIVCSDCETQAAAVRELGIGEVFAAGDSAALAAAVRLALGRRAELRARLAEPEVVEWASWARQEAALIGVYERLGVLRGVGAPGAPGRPEAAIRLGIGPRNLGGQAWNWARAVERSLPTARAESFSTEFPSGSLELSHRSDWAIRRSSWEDEEWQAGWFRRITHEYTHLLVEQGRGVSGPLHGSLRRELLLLREAGVRVALVCQGSEIRDPDRHAEREPFSPFRDGFDPRLLERLRERTRELHELIDELRPPVFVTTPDLIDDLPQATLLPGVVRSGEWPPGPPVPGGSPPRVLHAPSKDWTKGAALVDAACEPLDRAGVISYRRLHGIPRSRLPDEFHRADIVIDQLVMGSFGTQALEAMSCGRVVVAHVSEAPLRRLPAEPPVVRATPDTLEEVLRGLVADPERLNPLGLAGRDYVERHHDGAASAAALRPFLESAGATAPPVKPGERV